MFCKNCGAQLSNETKFCSNCGTAVEASVKESAPAKQLQPTAPVQQAPVQPAAPVTPTQTQQPVQNVQGAPQKPKSKGKKIGGIVMVVFGALGFLGGISNGFFENISTGGADMSDIVAMLLMIGLIAGGAYMIYKSKNQE